MLAALDAMRNGMPCATAAKQYKVPRVTVLYKFRGIYPEARKMGPDSRLSVVEEDQLAQWIFVMAKKGFPISKECFMASAARLVNELGKAEKFNNKPPGRKWFQGFLRRNPAVSTRIAQNLTKSRAAVTKLSLENWFTEIKKYLEDQNELSILEDGNRVFNADESAFCFNPKNSKVLARRGDKTVYQSGNNDDKQTLTVLLTANAAGKIAPPMIVFKYTRIPSYLAQAVPPEWAIGKSDSGWMTCETFFEYITNIFYPWLLKNNIPRPVIFFVDGHVSHMSLHLSNFCSSNGIILIALLPNATHLIQPLDVAVFRTLKQGWSEEVHAWRINHQCEELKKTDFAPLLDAVIRKRITPSILSNGFRKCGLVPWNSDAIPMDNIVNQSVERETSRTNGTEINKFEEHLKYLEKYIGEGRLKLFKETENNDWRGKIEDKSLFMIWVKMQNDYDLLKTGDENLNSAEELASKVNVNEKILMNKRTNCDNSEIGGKTSDLFMLPSRPHSHTPPLDMSQTPEQLTVQPSTSGSQQISDNNNQPSTSTSITNSVATTFPSPFKRALVWPEEKKSNKKRKIKERVPSVVTSFQWQEYTKTKQEEKEKAAKEKAFRKQQREEKKREKELVASIKNKSKKKPKKVALEDSDNETSDSDDISFQESEVSIEDEDESTMILPVGQDSLRKGDYIMVEFRGGKRGTTVFHYACIIQEIENTEVSVMALNCIDKNKKVFIPREDDISTIKYSQIVGLITPPRLQVVGERLRYVFDNPVSVTKM